MCINWHPHDLYLDCGDGYIIVNYLYGYVLLYIKVGLGLFDCNLDEMANPDLKSYRNLNAFFYSRFKSRCSKYYRNKWISRLFLFNVIISLMIIILILYYYYSY